jgi:hypothetical protein
VLGMHSLNARNTGKSITENLYFALSNLRILLLQDVLKIAQKLKYEDKEIVEEIPW